MKHVCNRVAFTLGIAVCLIGCVVATLQRQHLKAEPDIVQASPKTTTTPELLPLPWSEPEPAFVPVVVRFSQTQHKTGMHVRVTYQ